MSVRVSGRPLSVAAAYRALEDARSGGVVVFVGRVRPDRSSRPAGRVAALRYEAHVPMAEAGLRRLEEEARRRFGARRVILWHRTGRLGIGVPSVIVGVATPHREAAFTAARWLIAALKQRVPIWKTDLPARGARRRR